MLDTPQCIDKGQSFAGPGLENRYRHRSAVAGLAPSGRLDCVDSVSGMSPSIADARAWPFDEFQAWADRTDHHDQELEQIREVTVSHTQDDRLDAESRKRWAKLSLHTNARMTGEHPWQQARKADNNLRLRTLIIDRLGPDESDPDWNPNVVASDILAVLTLTPATAREMSSHWQILPIDQIASLRRHKNATAPLQQLLRHLQPGPTHDHAREWLAVRDLLP